MRKIMVEIMVLMAIITMLPKAEAYIENEPQWGKVYSGVTTSVDYNMTANRGDNFTINMSASPNPVLVGFSGLQPGTSIYCLSTNNTTAIEMRGSNWYFNYWSIWFVVGSDDPIRIYFTVNLATTYSYSINVTRATNPLEERVKQLEDNLTNLTNKVNNITVTNVTNVTVNNITQEFHNETYQNFTNVTNVTIVNGTDITDNLTKIEKQIQELQDRINNIKNGTTYINSTNNITNNKNESFYLYDNDTLCRLQDELNNLTSRVQNASKDNSTVYQYINTTQNQTHYTNRTSTIDNPNTGMAVGAGVISGIVTGASIAAISKRRQYRPTLEKPKKDESSKFKP